MKDTLYLISGRSVIFLDCTGVIDLRIFILWGATRLIVTSN